MNRILTFLDIVKRVRKTVTAKDFPEPLPPVIIKYLASDLNSAVYLSLRFRAYKVY